MTRLGTWMFLMVSALMALRGFAGTGSIPAGGRSAALAQASIALFDPWGILNNQAGMVSCSTLVCGIYAENRFMMKELGYQAGFLLIPARPGVAGLSFTRYGHAAYNENELGITYARSFGLHFHAGLQLTYSFIFAMEKEYRYSQAGFAAGIITQLTPDLFLALHIVDPVNWQTGKNGGIRTGNSLLQMGMAYHLSEKIVLTAQAEKEPAGSIQVMAGFEYQLSPALTFRSGIMAHPVQVSFGTGTHWKRLFIDLSATMHQQLGWFPQVSLRFVAR